MTSLVDGETLSRLKGPVVINLGGSAILRLVGASCLVTPSWQDALSVSVLASEPNGSAATLLRPYDLVCRLNPDL